MAETMANVATVEYVGADVAPAAAPEILTDPGPDMDFGPVAELADAAIVAPVPARAPVAEFSIARAELKRTLTILRPLCRSVTPGPRNYRYVRLTASWGLVRAQEGFVNVCASGPDTWAEIRIPAMVITPGVIVAEHAQLAVMLGKGKGYVRLEAGIDGQTWVCRIGGATLLLDEDAARTMDLPPADPETFAAWWVESDVLVQALQRTIPAAAKEKDFYALNGLLLAGAPDSNMLEIVACDGGRLHIQQVGATANVVNAVPAVLPTAAAGIMQRVLTMCPGLAMLKVTGTPATGTVAAHACRVQLNTGRGDCVSSAAVEGAFPNYKEVVPAAPPFLTCEAGVLAAVFQDGARMAPHGGQVLDLVVRPGHYVRVQGDWPGVGQFSEPIPEGPGTVAHRPFKVSFNPWHVVDILHGMSDLTPVTLASHDYVSPAVFTSDAVPGFTAVLCSIVRQGYEDDSGPYFEDCPEAAPVTEPCELCGAPLRAHSGPAMRPHRAMTSDGLTHLCCAECAVNYSRGTYPKSDEIARALLADRCVRCGRHLDPDVRWGADTPCYVDRYGVAAVCNECAGQIRLDEINAEATAANDTVEE